MRGRPHRPPPWWPHGETWPPPEGKGFARWGGPPWWREGGPPRGLARRFGCLIVLLATVMVSVGVLVLWLLASLFGVVSAEGPLAALARPAGLVVLVVGLVAVVVGIRLARSVAPPLGDLVDAAGRVESGDYSVRVRERVGGPQELRGLTHAFNTMAARLEAEDAARRRLLADVSHELRTPLAVIQGNLEALLDGVYPPDEAHLGPILEETRVMTRLVDDLRTLSLAESGSLPLHRESTDLAVLLEDVAASQRTRTDGATIDISVAVEGRLPALEVDPVRIRQVLTNLVDNAIRAMPGGGTVELRARVETDAVAVDVVDDGPGIPAELLPHVFDRFTKSPASRGSGLGLAIAEAIVTAHGGTIAAERATTDGRTRIRIALPMR
jgi:two-component system sensor histidine kinase BaeS